MPWYPDWLVALSECAKSEGGKGIDQRGERYGRAIVQPHHARDIIEQLTALKRENKQLRAERDVTSGAPLGDPPSR
jgi:hypothetical protein